mgnify:CR=1 FL=1
MDNSRKIPPLKGGSKEKLDAVGPDEPTVQSSPGFLSQAASGDEHSTPEQRAPHLPIPPPPSVTKDGGVGSPGGAQEPDEETIALDGASLEEVSLTDPPPPPKEGAPEGSEGASGAGERASPPVRRAFGRYELLMEMGMGGMASLYLARLKGPESFQKLLAIKRIHSQLARQQSFINMFLDEARIAALIHHPNVATTFDMGSVDGSYYIAMEYVHGHNLGEILRESARAKKSLPWAYAAHIVANAAKGLHAAHELKNSEGEPLDVVHRDVSPQNILVSYDGHVKVVDFGVAYAAERLVHTSTGTVKGKTAYMSPEQIRAKPLDRRSDVFALGIVLFEAVCMRRLFKSESDAATMMRVVEAQVPSVKEIRSSAPLLLDKIVQKALAKDPDQRYATAGDLADDLEELLVAEGQMVSENKIAKLMSALFHHKREVKDREIQRVSKKCGETVPESVAVGVTSGTSIEPPEDVSRTKMGASSRSLYFVSAGFVLLAVVLGVGGYFWLSSRDEGSKAPGKDRGAEMGAGREGRGDGQGGMAGMVAEKAKVLVQIKVEPKGIAAEVTFGKRRYKGSVVEAMVKRSDEPKHLHVEAPGYKTETLMVVPSRDRVIPVVLMKEAPKTPEPGEDARVRRATRPSRRRRPRRRITRRAAPRLKGLPD